MMPVKNRIYSSLGSKHSRYTRVTLAHQAESHTNLLPKDKFWRELLLETITVLLDSSGRSWYTMRKAVKWSLSSLPGISYLRPYSSFRISQTVPSQLQQLLQEMPAGKVSLFISCILFSSFQPQPIDHSHKINWNVTKCLRPVLQPALPYPYPHNSHSTAILLHS